MTPLFFCGQCLETLDSVVATFIESLFWPKTMSFLSKFDHIGNTETIQVCSLCWRILTKFDTKISISSDQKGIKGSNLECSIIRESRIHFPSLESELVVISEFVTKNIYTFETGILVNIGDTVML